MMGAGRAPHIERVHSLGSQMLSRLSADATLGGWVTWTSDWPTVGGRLGVVVVVVRHTAMKRYVGHVGHVGCIGTRVQVPGLVAYLASQLDSHLAYGAAAVTATDSGAVQLEMDIPQRLQACGPGFGLAFVSASIAKKVVLRWKRVNLPMMLVGIKAAQVWAHKGCVAPEGSHNCPMLFVVVVVVCCYVVASLLTAMVLLPHHSLTI